MDVEVGTVVGGKYKLVRLLGRGGMGQVWVARHRTLDLDVAIKLMTPLEVDDDLAEGAETALARFQLEARVAASLSKKSRNIVAVTDHGYDQGNPYLVMELLEGEGLDALLDRERILAPERVVAIITQAARGLSVAHAEGVVHRDLKPANMFLTFDETRAMVVKLVDFGIASLERRPTEGTTQKLTGRGIVLGSVHYMSPEQARGVTAIDRHVDLWALSVVAYEALTGVMPFDGKTPEDTIARIFTEQPRPVSGIVPTLPVAFDDFFRRAFARDVRQRFASVEALAAAFASAANGAGRAIPLDPGQVETSAIEMAEPLPSSRSPVNRAIVLSILGAIAVLTIIGLGYRISHPRTTVETAALTPSSEPTHDAPTLTERVDSPPPSAPTSATAKSTATTQPAVTATTSARPTPTGPAPVATTATSAGGTASPKPSATVDKAAVF